MWDRCLVMLLSTNMEENIIAKTDFHEFAAVACLNGELAFFFYATPIGLKSKVALQYISCLKMQTKNDGENKDIGWHTM